MREGRRRLARTPGIWRGALAGAGRRNLQHGGWRGGGFPGWRLLSGFLTLALGAVLGVFFASEVFYVRSLSVEGLDALTREEVYALADIAEAHLFTVNPARVEENILRSSSVATARVTLGWPPEMVQVTLEERQPALVWEQAGVTTWIDLQGRVMLQREERGDLLRVSALDNLEGPPGPNVQLEAEIVRGALQLQVLLPEVQQLRYHPNEGLGYTAAGGWQVWLGVGADMSERVLVYDALVRDLRRRGIAPTEVNVANPHAPYYSLGGGQ